MDILKFAQDIGKLKTLKRTGWVIMEIPLPESVAEHSLRVAMLAMVLSAKFKVDQHKVIKMSLIHDLGEAEIGDIVTIRGGKHLPNLAEKIRVEREAMEKILNSLPDKSEYLALFDEYEENKTPEAKLVKQLDRLECAMQAAEYEKLHKVTLDEFFQTADSQIHDEYLREILQSVLDSRKTL